jgi:hypothetical protein
MHYKQGIERVKYAAGGRVLAHSTLLDTSLRIDVPVKFDETTHLTENRKVPP